MHPAIVAAICSSILHTGSCSLRSIHKPHYRLFSLDQRRQLAEMDQREAKQEIVAETRRRIRGNTYATPYNNTINGMRLKAEVIFNPSFDNLDLKFWHEDDTEIRADPDVSFAFSLDILPDDLYLPYQGSLRDYKSIPIRIQPTRRNCLTVSSRQCFSSKLRSDMVRFFNKKLKTLLEAKKHDFESINFIPDGDREGVDSII
ncbi:hypothetical protein FOZ62_013433, partial [Perkinsus olseni]